MAGACVSVRVARGKITRHLHIPGLLLALLAATALAAACGGDEQPAATPGASTDGKIAFVSSREGSPEIYIMNADGSGQTRLTNNPADVQEPGWSPDGRRIAFVSNRDGKFRDLRR